MLNQFFLLQSVCGLVAVGTAISWVSWGKAAAVHRWRLGVLTVALATVIGGWPIEHKVSNLRLTRNEATDAYLALAPDDCCLPGVSDEIAMATNPSPENVQSRTIMDAARADFATWHVVSLLLNFATAGLVTVGMALAAFVPKWEKAGEAEVKSSKSDERVHEVGI